MPIVIDKNIPAYSLLSEEQIFIMDKERAGKQDIRPIEIAILNLMPTKKETETQFMRLLSNSPLQVNITLIHTESYRSKNTEAEYLERFYQPFEKIKDRHFDGMIVTGAPLEDLDFSSVAYWDELKKLFEFTRTNVTSTIFICWGAMAALNYFYNIPKYPLPRKMFGVFAHRKTNLDSPDPLMRGISDEFHMCHSRHSTIRESDIKKDERLKILAASHRAGVSVLCNTDHSQVFVLGHMEYDRDTLKREYERDLAKGLPIEKPFCYFADKEGTEVKMNWTSTSNLFYNNWLNFVYQTTPYRL
ncbi:MAG: homoserine O-succinyltransferase [Clostridia bacterium]|nr:homoserine O-succinyltransferase [Clostridia bacterium]